MHRLKLINDPKFPQQALAEYQARVVLPQVLTTIISLGKYLGATCRETLENQSLGDLPVILIHGTEFTTFVKTDTEEERREWVRKYLDAWAATTKLSTKGSAPIEIKGANHVTIIAYREYADQVSGTIRGMVEKARSGVDSRP